MSPMLVPIESLYRIGDFLLVIYTNWHPVSYGFKIIADYCSNFGRKRSLCVL